MVLREQKPIKEKVYDFIVRFSTKHLRFPSTPEICKAFQDVSETSIYEHIAALTKEDKIYKVGRYGFGIASHRPKGFK